MIPLILRLKKAAHREIAKAQDLIVEALYEVFDDAILHGGTSIWRCYEGNRFSEDVDVYFPRDVKKISALFKAFEKKGFLLEKRRIKEKSIYSTLNLNNTIVRFEAVFRKASGSLKEYEKAEGNLLTVYTLTPEELIKEKAATYLKRRKIRDLYDIFFLLRYVEGVSAANTVKEALNGLLAKFNAPVDEAELRVLLFEGLVPTTEKMLIYIKDVKARL